MLNQKPIRLAKKRSVVAIDYCISILLSKIVSRFSEGAPNWTSYGHVDHLLASQGFNAKIDEKNSAFFSNDMANVSVKVTPTGDKKVNITVKLITIYKKGIDGASRLIWQPLEGEIEVPEEQPMNFNCYYQNNDSLHYEVIV